MTEKQFRIKWPNAILVVLKLKTGEWQGSVVSGCKLLEQEFGRTLSEMLVRLSAAMWKPCIRTR